MKKLDRGQLINSELSGGCCKSKKKPAPCPAPVPPSGGGSGGLNSSR
ncbi:hypothetical protein M2D07_020925 [Pseudomonas sp. BGr12]|nr:hypothetical protein [Pseudomonas sp. BJa5]MDL2429491.1 hypothetical protein [Pseudomonas sp. BJa5]